MKKIILFIFPAIFLLSCQKEISFDLPIDVIDSTGTTPVENPPGGTNGDECVKSFDITASDSLPTVGDTIVLTANPSGWIYRWSGPNNFFQDASGSSNTIRLDNVAINQAGWYYCTIAGLSCTVLIDSIYIDVKYKQETPSCTLTNNTIYGSGLPDLTATDVTKSFSATWNDVSVSASRISALLFFI